VAYGLRDDHFRKGDIKLAVVAKASDIPPGTIKRFEVDGEGIAVANVDGSFYAFGDECTHQGCSLAEGDLEGKTVICFCHGGQYDITTGEVISGPPPEPVKSYACTIEGDSLVIS
jgi:nitrite reductase/ring-hydroxylating ferredoxin subunit